MKLKKPDIFLGIVLCMLVLAAVLCIVILYVQKHNTENPVVTDTQSSTIDTAGTGETGNTNSPSGGNTEPSQQTPPVTEPEPIDEAALKAALNESLRGLTSEWEVVVYDPATNLRIGSAINCGVNDWMTANRMTQVFIMGAVFQQANDGKLVLDDVMDDLKAMIISNDSYAADRLTEKLGGGSAETGREAVKTFAVANGVQLGFNRPNSGTSSKKNYVSAQQTATILNLICRGELVSEAASQQMLEILMTQRQTDIDPNLAAENAQYGFITDVEDGTCICAMGVVKLPNRDFVISVVCNKPVTTDGAKKKVAELIGLAERYFTQ